MIKEDYVKTDDYIESVQLLKEFISDELDGEIEGLMELDFSTIKNSKYIGSIKDPDMFMISQAIYIIMWGHIWDLRFSNMGSWGKNAENRYSFRGDTIHAFGKIGNSKNREFGYRAKYFKLDMKEELWNRIELFYKSYHRIGNFIVIPNRAEFAGGINTARANWLTGMRDYFDWFLIAIYNYQQRTLGNEKNVIKGFDIVLKSRKSFECMLAQNDEYKFEFLPINKWRDIFYLNSFFEEDIPVKFFNTEPKDRLKITTIEEKRNNQERYFDNNEYYILINEYIEKSSEFINHRTSTIIDELKTNLRRVN